MISKFFQSRQKGDKPMKDENAEVFAMVVAVHPSKEQEEICMGGKGTVTTWKGLDKDD